jgi:hypothetical protein
VVVVVVVVVVWGVSEDQLGREEMGGGVLIAA